MAETTSVYLSVSVLTVLSFVCAPIHVIAVVTHTLRIVFLVRMGAVGDSLNLLFGEHVDIHWILRVHDLLTIQVLLL